jgi:hypothetical protein
MYYPCTFCTCPKYKSTAVHHRRRPAFAVLIIPLYKRYMGSTSEKGILKTAKAGRRRWCTAVDLYFAHLSIPFSDVLPMYLWYLSKIQVNGRTPSTTACLRRLKYSLLRCTTHVPFVLVQVQKVHG